MKILLVDDHAIILDGVRRLLADAYPEATFGEAASSVAAMDALRSDSWDLVILDLSLPGRDRLDLVKTVHEQWPRLPILVFTMYGEEQYALRSIRAGATGYVCKTSATTELVLAVGRLLAGGRYVSVALAEHMAARLVTDEGRPLHEALSDREFQVLRLLAKGLTVKEIGFELKLSDKTISTYRTRVLDKMSMRTASQLMRYAIQMELVE